LADDSALPAVLSAMMLRAGRAATDRCLLAAEPTAANPLQRRAAVE